MKAWRRGTAAVAVAAIVAWGWARAGGAPVGCSRGGEDAREDEEPRAGTSGLAAPPQTGSAKAAGRGDPLGSAASPAPTVVTEEYAKSLHVEPNMDVDGQVTDEDGAPLAGAQVQGEWDVDSKLVPTPVAVTGPDGRFSLRVTNDDWVCVTVSCPGYATAGFGWTAREGGVLRLRREDRRRVRLHVEGAPTGTDQVAVCIVRASERFGWPPEATDRHPLGGGVVELEEPFDADRYHVLVRAGEGAFGVASFVVGPGPGATDVPVDVRPRPVLVRPVDGHGRPVTGLSARAEALNGLPWRATVATDEATGLARLLVPRAGRWRIVAWNAEWEGTRELDEGATEVVIAGGRLPRLRGCVAGWVPPPTVVGAAPMILPPIPLVGESSRGDEWIVEVSLRRQAGPPWMAVAPILEDGTFSVPLPPLGAGDQVTVGARRGLLRGPVREVRMEDGATTLDVTVVRPPEGGALRGIVRDDRGQRVAGARIEGCTDGESDGPWITVATSEVDGRFELQHGPDGTIWLRVASAAGGPAVSAHAGEEPVELRVARPGSVHGRLVSRWNPIPGPVEILAARHPGTRGQAWTSVASYGADGEFDVTDVPPGRVRLLASCGPEAVVGPEVEVAPGEVTDLGEIPLGPAGTVEGLALSSSGTPAANLVLEVEDPRGGGPRRVVADDQGRFRAEGLWAGTWRVGPLDRPEASVRVEVSAGGRHPLTIRVP